MRVAQKTRYALVLVGLTLMIVVSLSAALVFEFNLTSRDMQETAAASMDEALLQQYQRRAIDLSNSLAFGMVNSIYLLDVDSIRTVVNGVAGQPDVNGVAVYDLQGLLYAAGSQNQLPAGAALPLDRIPVVEFLADSVTATSPILLADETIGHVAVNLSLEPITRDIAAVRADQEGHIASGLRYSLSVSLAISLTFGLVSVVLAVVVGNRLSRPVQALTRMAGQVGRGDFVVPSDIESSGEIRDLVTSFVSMARELKQTTVRKSYLDEILNGMLDGLMVVGPELTILTVNRASCLILGHPEAELIGQPVTAFLEVPQSDMPNGNAVRPREGIARIKGGDALPVLVSTAELADRPGLDPVTIWVFRDIAGLKATQNALVSAMREAERANHAKSQFLANMSHELRTPLNAIIGYSEILLEETQETGATAMAEDLRRIHGAGKHLLGLINDVLDLSKIEAGKMELTVEGFDVRNTVMDVVATVEPLVAGNDNRLTVDCPPDLPSMQSDQLKLRQILFNILSNAAKFTHGGHIAVSVGTETLDDGAWLNFAIADTGIGMSSQQIQRIFHEFLQGDATTTREFGGTGLGLAISRRMARMLGGDIKVSSKRGKGTTFTVHVPTRLPGTRPAAIAAPRRLAGTAVASRIVLAIDDDLEILESLARRLTRWGFRAVVASRGREGLRLARELRPFAILLDVAMPDMDGWAVLRELRADPVTMATPVITTSVVDDQVRRQNLRVSAFVRKPIDWQFLFETLAGLLPEKSDRAALLAIGDANTRASLAAKMRVGAWIVREESDARGAVRSARNSPPDIAVIDLPLAGMESRALLEAIRDAGGTKPVRLIVLTVDPDVPDHANIARLADAVVDRAAPEWMEAVRVIGGSSVGRSSPLETAGAGLD